MKNTNIAMITRSQRGRAGTRKNLLHTRILARVQISEHTCTTICITSQKLFASSVEHDIDIFLVYIWRFSSMCQLKL